MTAVTFEKGMPEQQRSSPRKMPASTPKMGLGRLEHSRQGHHPVMFQAGFVLIVVAGGNSSPDARDLDGQEALHAVLLVCGH